MKKLSLLAGLGILAFFGSQLRVARTASGQAASGQATASTRVPVVFSGGHDTDPGDMGRPVVLLAAALHVPTEVFREAFTHVNPAGAGERPDPEDVRRNKAALLQALSRYGVTNERLDAVSDYYRYDRRRGLWPTRDAKADAVLKNGKVLGFEVTDSGSGYSSVPALKVPSVALGRVEAELGFSQNFDHNGSIAAVKMITSQKK